MMTLLTCPCSSAFKSFFSVKRTRRLQYISTLKRAISSGEACINQSQENKAAISSRFDATPTISNPDQHHLSMTTTQATTFSPTILLAISATILLILINVPSAEAFTFTDLVQTIETQVQHAGSLAPILFISFYALATVLLVPASALTIAAGFLFGPIFGTIIVSIASTTGAAMAFLVGRYLARPFVAQKLASSDVRFSAVDAAIASQGMRIVFLLRLSPLFPFTLLNYALSITSIPFVEYTIASWLGMIPGTIAYVALGGAGKAAAESAAGFGGTSPIQLFLYILGAASTLGATVLISRAASQALRDAQQQDSE